MDKYYKSRKEAEKIRKKGEPIYYVANKGYYIIHRKKEKIFTNTYIQQLLTGSALWYLFGSIIAGSINNIIPFILLIIYKILYIKTSYNKDYMNKEKEE